MCGRRRAGSRNSRWAAGFARSLTQVVAASTAGVPTEKLAERGVRDGTKLVLAGVVLVGGLGGSPGRRG